MFTNQADQRHEQQQDQNNPINGSTGNGEENMLKQEIGQTGKKPGNEPEVLDEAELYKRKQIKEQNEGGF